MSATKCIYRDIKDDDELASSPCFQISPEVQLKDVPTNGEEYLLKVMQERKNLRTITKCHEDYSKFAKNQSCFVNELPHAKAPEQLKPTIEWQNIQVADFSDIRMYISRILANKSLRDKNVKKIELQEYSMAGWKEFFAKREPTLSCVLGLNHVLLDYGLEALTRIISKTQPGHTIDHKIGQWIYAFLACTRQPLLSDTISILRNLARKCADISEKCSAFRQQQRHTVEVVSPTNRQLNPSSKLEQILHTYRSDMKNESMIDPDDDNARTAVGPLNIFICLVGRYFRQYDLAD